MSSAKSGIDIVQLLRGEQTINDRIVSSVVEKTCYTIAWLHGKEYCIEKGIKIHYNSREHRFSSTEIKTRLKN